MSPTKNDEWKKENSYVYNMRVSKNTEFYSALEKAAKDREVAPSAYIRAAVTEKLQRDGYLPEK